MSPLGVLISDKIIFFKLYSSEITAVIIGIFLHISTIILFESSENHNFKLDDFSTIIPIDNTIYKLYDTSLKLFDTGEESIFIELKEIYFEKIDRLGEKEQLIFFRILQNYAIQKARIEEEKYLPIIVDCFKIGLKKEILLDNGMIKSVTFINIIGMAIKNKEDDWANLIIETYKDKILEETKGFTYKLSTAIIAFYKKEYSKVISILNTSSSTSRLNNYGLKTLIIRAAFKTIPEDNTYYELFTTHCSSFEKYLTRDAIIVTKKVEMYLEFIKEIKIIGKIIFQKKLTSTLKIQLIEELKQNLKITYKSWLIGALQEISCP